LDSAEIRGVHGPGGLRVGQGLEIHLDIPAGQAQNERAGPKRLGPCGLQLVINLYSKL